MEVLNDGTSYQSFSLAFTDAAHADPHGVSVAMVSHAFAAPDLSRVVKLDYLFTNYSAATIDDYHAGLFIDWDVIDSLGNVGGTDAATRSVWVGMPDGPVYGMAVVGDAPVSNLTVVDNFEYVYPASHVSDLHKYQLLDGTISDQATAGPTDASAVVGVGPFTLAPGEYARVTFLLAYGDDVEDFLDTIVAAGGASGGHTGVDSELPGPALGLAQNAPNPFNPSTEISFALPRAGDVNLAVFDLAGRRVRNLLSGQHAGGRHVVRWNGRNDAGDQLASGIYLYQLYDEDGTLDAEDVTISEGRTHRGAPDTLRGYLAPLCVRPGLGGGTWVVAMVAVGGAAELRVMSFNLRRLADDGEDRGERRRRMVVDGIEGFGADLLWTQECLAFQRDEGWRRCRVCVGGVGRDNGGDGGEMRLFLSGRPVRSGGAGDVLVERSTR